MDTHRLHHPLDLHLAGRAPDGVRPGRPRPRGLGPRVRGAVTASSADAADAAHRPAAAKVTATIRFDGSGAKEKLQGQLKTPRKACKSQRTVKLFYKGPGDTGFNVVRSPRTSTSGAWVQGEPGDTGIPRGKLLRARRGQGHDLQGRPVADDPGALSAVAEPCLRAAGRPARRPG